MVVFPHCKINLGLNVVEKRSDGFHNIETCFYPLPLTDILEAVSSKEVQFNITGIEIPGTVESNLCLRAYHVVAADHNVSPVSIHLHKVIPMGAGIGGGSADGAFFLKLMNDFFSLSLSRDQLQDYARKLGSDCAFFLYDQPMLGSSRGDELNPCKVSLKGKFLILIKPSIHVGTAEAYRGVKPGRPGISVREVVEQAKLEEWKNVLVNDFEAYAFKMYPEIERIKGSLYQNGAVYASMSGSGSSVFGIFNSEVDLSAAYKDCFYWSGFLQH
jgi:4-diphosphocytidyl-2-C-methyl-D-erythritol kinase